VVSELKHVNGYAERYDLLIMISFKIFVQTGNDNIVTLQYNIISGFKIVEKYYVA
jgi:hypothetical protein